MIVRKNKPSTVQKKHVEECIFDSIACILNSDSTKTPSSRVSFQRFFWLGCLERFYCFLGYCFFLLYFKSFFSSRLFLSPHGGIELDKHGRRKKRWQWYYVKGHVHAPPFQPLCFSLNKFLSVRVLDQVSMSTKNTKHIKSMIEQLKEALYLLYFFFAELLKQLGTLVM